MPLINTSIGTRTKIMQSAYHSVNYSAIPSASFYMYCSEDDIRVDFN